MTITGIEIHATEGGTKLTIRTDYGGAMVHIPTRCNAANAADYLVLLAQRLREHVTSVEGGE